MWVCVLFEIARQLKLSNSNLGVDFIFFDAEDLGAPQDYNEQAVDDWCLGSQYWSKNPHIENYRADYGILLDMVGADDAVFRYEAYAYAKDPALYNRVWNVGQSLGYSSKFIKAQGAGITDDHVYVIRERNIPMIDIIDYDQARMGGFGHYHHTHQDNMDVISKSTLNAVGETVLASMQALNNE